MTQKDRQAKGLLPTGLSDTLWPAAAREAAASERLLGHFARSGYARVHPPLLEFEEGLAAFADGGKLPDMFRLLDPESRQVMALRSDITLQIARLAATRLAAAARPLRLAYAGPVLKVRGDQLRPARQFRQVGIELIGSRAHAADHEVARLALAGLADLGIGDLVIDLVAPVMLDALFSCWELDMPRAERLALALDAKDAASVHGELDDRRGAVLEELIAAAGPHAEAAPRLAALDLPAAAARWRDRLLDFAARLASEMPDVEITIDPCERRGFEYHTGLGFTVFSHRARGELGRGGRYRIRRGPGEYEAAVGFSAYMDGLLPLLDEVKEETAVYATADALRARIEELRRSGRTVIEALEPEDPDETLAHARTLGCGQVLDARGLHPVPANDESR
ncbi:MAG: ATP phosphoribosyltransferase regulatory subunit [Alphaproteobacteria bacterium]|nr:MAG: ATP phosphoribosyltransferase regulatory subunit [Alphaproteobacteria bacterium]